MTECKALLTHLCNHLSACHVAQNEQWLENKVQKSLWAHSVNVKLTRVSFVSFLIHCRIENRAFYSLQVTNVKSNLFSFLLFHLWD